MSPNINRIFVHICHADILSAHLVCLSRPLHDFSLHKANRLMSCIPFFSQMGSACLPATSILRRTRPTVGVRPQSLPIYLKRLPRPLLLPPPSNNYRSGSQSVSWPRGGENHGGEEIHTLYTEARVLRSDTGSLSHLRTMLPESSSCPQPAQRPNHAT